MSNLTTDNPTKADTEALGRERINGTASRVECTIIRRAVRRARIGRLDWTHALQIVASEDEATMIATAKQRGVRVPPGV